MSSWAFYKRLGWRAVEPASYEGQPVTIMDIEPTSSITPRQ